MQGLYRLHVVWCSRHTRKMPHNGREGRGVGGQSSHDQICLLSEYVDCCCNCTATCCSTAFEILRGITQGVDDTASHQRVR